MKALMRSVCLLALVGLLGGACTSTPDSETTAEETAAKPAMEEMEEIEDLVVHTFDDPRDDLLLEGNAWVWPDNPDITNLVRSHESVVLISEKTDSPDDSPYLVWNSELDFDRQRFPTRDADINRGVRFLYSPLFAHIRQFEPDGLFFEIRSSLDMPLRVQLHGRGISAGARLRLKQEWQRIYVPFSLFGAHIHGQEGGDAPLTDDLLGRFFELGLEQNIHELRDSGTLRANPGKLKAAVDINAIGMYRVEGSLPEHIVEHFDSPLPHIQLQHAGIEIFTDQEDERRRTDILVNPSLTAGRLAKGGGAAGTTGFYSLHTSFEIGDNAKQLRPQTNIGVVSNFRGAVDMSRYNALRLAVRASGLRSMSLWMGSDRMRTGIHRGIEIPRENEWIEVEIPFYEFRYDERAALTEETLLAFLESVNQLNFDFSVHDTLAWQGSGEDKASFIGTYEVKLDLDNIELVGSMPAFSEFMSRMKQYREQN